jgi:hypothetical protein
MWKRFYAKYPLFLSDFNENLIFTTDFLEKSLNLKFIKILPVGVEFSIRSQTDIDRQTGGQT